MVLKGYEGFLSCFREWFPEGWEKIGEMHTGSAASNLEFKSNDFEQGVK